VSGLAQLAAWLRAAAAAMPEELRVAAAEGGAAAAAAAKAIMGSYPSGEGPFWEWPELKGSTQARREQLGYTRNDPLVMSGGLRDTITHRVEEHGFAIGSPDPKIVFSEHGTRNEEPRPALGRGVYEARHDIVAGMVRAVARAFSKA
jgi:hypothetical protein